MGSAMRIAVVRDFLAEGWPSMDLCADQLLALLPPSVAAVDVSPAFRRVCGRLPFARRAAFNADRVLNRHVLLPRVVRRAARGADFVHVVDHSYAHVASAVPAGRAGVYCHDLDAFRCLLDPAGDPRPWWFRRLTRRTLDGLRRAAVVFHNSADVGRQLRDAGIVRSDRLVHAPLGVADEFTPEAVKPVTLPLALNPPFLLHVGSAIPRKRLDVLLEVFAAVRARVPGLRMVRVGGAWPPALAERAAAFGPSIVRAENLSREQLAEFYRRAAAVLVPSEAEGFGLPVIEALACGAAVAASDIPTLREAGGAAVVFCPVADVPAWTEAVRRILIDPSAVPASDIRLSQAAKFSWRAHARVIAEAYLRLAG